jgi:hypothetical protein
MSWKVIQSHLQSLALTHLQCCGIYVPTAVSFSKEVPLCFIKYLLKERYIYIDWDWGD